jgi:Uma2 family endonuclease
MVMRSTRTRSHWLRDLLSPELNAEHYMGMPARTDTHKRWTLQEVRDLRDRSTDGTRYELVDGELLVTPSPSGAHQNAVMLLWAKLYPYMRAGRLGQAAVAPKDVEFPAEEATTQPDVFVVPTEELERYLGARPVERLLLAAEVLSPSSARGDRVKKRALFQRTHVSEYWIVDLEARVFERWHPDDERPQIIADRIEWRPAGASESFVLDLPSYFAEVFFEDV